MAAAPSAIFLLPLVLVCAGAPTRASVPAPAATTVAPTVLATVPQWSEVDEIRFRVETPWPRPLGKGYFPLWVEVNSGHSERKVVELRVSSQGWNSAELTATKRIAIEPGERRLIEIFVPIFASEHSGYSPDFFLEASVGTELSQTAVPISSFGWDENKRSLMLFTERPAQESDVEQLAERVAGVSPTGPSTGAGTTTTRVGGATISITRRPAAGTAAPAVSAGIARFSRIPSHYEAFTSLDLVLVDLSGGGPPSETLEPLLAWVRLGGRVLFYGDGATRALEEMELTAPWLEERFLLERHDHSTSYAMGLGLLYVGDSLSGLLESADDVLAVRSALDPGLGEMKHGSWIPFPGSWRLAGSRIKIPGIDGLPLRAFVVFLLLFAMTIGPVNLIVLKKLRRPAWMLLSVPVLSFAAALLLVAYGIFYQGVDVKSSAHTLTLLDQRARRSSTVERRSLFIGLSPGPGLLPAAGTSVYPEVVTDDSEHYDVDFTEGLILSGRFQAVRDPFEQVVLTERSDRSRLTVRSEAGEIVVENTFPTRIEKLVLVDEHAGWLELTDPLDPGESARLEPVDAFGPTALKSAFPEHALLADCELSSSSYAALLQESPFRDDCGLDMNERDSLHAVIGILPLEPSEWE